MVIALGKSAEMKEKHIPKYFSGEKYVKPVRLSILRTRAYTEVWKATEGEPQTIRRAKAFARYLDTVPLFIRPFERIAGYHSEDPSVLPLSIEVIDSKIVQAYVKEGYIIPEEKAEWFEHIEYWSKRNLGAMIANMLSPEEKKLLDAMNRYIEPPPTHYTSRTQPDHYLYLEQGLNSIIALLNDKMVKLNQEKEDCRDGKVAVEISLKMNDVKAMMITAQAVIRWANRYSALAKEMAATETDPQRKSELLKIADMCAWVPANPARDFWEALQSHWLTLLAYHVIELVCHGTSLRPDVVFWQWYEQDVLKNKTMTKGEAVELIQELLLHIDELGRPLGLSWRKGLQGVNYLATLTLGGVKLDGTDACNDLSVAFLDAVDGLRISHPDLKFRWHPRVNPRVWRRAIEVVRSGLGQPSIRNDVVIIPQLMTQQGYTLEEARSWATLGCLAPHPTLHWGAVRRDFWKIYPAKMLELALNNGVDPVPVNGKLQQVGVKSGDATKFTSFEEVMEAFRKQLEWACRKSTQIRSLAEYCNGTLIKRPFASCIFQRALDACRDVMDAPDKGYPLINMPGRVDTVDSLISLKKVVFVDKKYTMAEAVKAMQNNWAGAEEMRREFVKAPKFGNDDDFADDVARDVYNMMSDEAKRNTDLTGMHPRSHGLVVTWMFGLAPQTGALPNGRKLGDYLADGGISPHAGYDRNGPFAAVLSAVKIDHMNQVSNIFNQKLTPGSVEGEAGLNKLQRYIETALNLGLETIQFNIVDTKTLKDAQKHPEKYGDLIVRVSGYNAHFVELDKFVQDAVIERTLHELC